MRAATWRRWVQAVTLKDPAPKYTGTEMPMGEWIEQVLVPELLPRTIFDGAVQKVFGLDQ